MIKVAVAGAGYFSHFHLEAWHRIPGFGVVAIADTNLQKRTEAGQLFGVTNLYSGVEEMLEAERPDVLDIITPPETHAAICEAAAKRGVHVMVQKPLAPTPQQSLTIVNTAEAAGIRLMVHENFRFQPWYRHIKQLLQANRIGTIYSCLFRMRMGDGWQKDAYLARQPYFRQMPRLLVYETGIHFIDTFRFLFGEIKSVYAVLNRRNPDIKGEDAGIIHFNFVNGMHAVWDASRYNESDASNPRYTFGEMQIDGSDGTLHLLHDGSISLKPLGKNKELLSYHPSEKNFAGDCVFETIRHFADCLVNGVPFETGGEDYLRNIRVQEAIYKSSETNSVIELEKCIDE